MENKILGLHHITAIAGGAQRNYDFYSKVLGLRLVKKTVNFDDPGTYHLYYGNEVGSPGTILTFFPWERVKQGQNGAGMATEIGYAIPQGSLGYWQERLSTLNVKQEPIAEAFGEKFLQLQDPDGLLLKLIEPATNDNRIPWITTEIPPEFAVYGFHSVVLALHNHKPTAVLLTTLFDYEFVAAEGNRFRYRTDAVSTANIIDIIEDPKLPRGINAGGTNHHVAFRVKDDDVLMDFRKKVAARGFSITEKIDRNYFYSLYFREPGGVLFELASDNPGFTADEPKNELGTNLKLPPQYEASRQQIERSLAPLVTNHNTTKEDNTPNA